MWKYAVFVVIKWWLEQKRSTLPVLKAIKKSFISLVNEWSYDRLLYFILLVNIKFIYNLTISIPIGATLVCLLQLQVGCGHKSSAKNNKSILWKSTDYIKFIIKSIYSLFFNCKNFKNHFNKVI